MSANFLSVSVTGSGSGDTPRQAYEAAKAAALNSLESRPGNIRTTWAAIDSFVHNLYDSEDETDHGTDLHNQGWWNVNYKSVIDDEFKLWGLK